MLKITVSGCRGRRDDCNAADEGRERYELLGVKKPVGLQLLDGLLPFSGERTYRIRGVDADDGEAESIDRVPLDLDLDQHGDAGMQTLPCLGFEISHEHLFVARPTGRSDFGFLVFYQFEVEVSAFLAQAAYLGLHPIRRPQTLVQRFTDEGA